MEKTVLAGLFYASYRLLISLFVDNHPPHTVTALVTCTGAFFLLPIIFTEDLCWLTAGGGWLVMLYLGLVATAFSYLIFAKGLTATQISTELTLPLAEPLVATVLGIMVVGERLTGSVLIGIMLLCTAMVVLVGPDRNSPRVSQG